MADGMARGQDREERVVAEHIDNPVELPSGSGGIWNYWSGGLPWSMRWFVPWANRFKKSDAFARAI
jgi:hypothetical protein